MDNETDVVEPDTIPFEACLVMFDVSDYWNMSRAPFAYMIDRIEEVRLFDRMKWVHLCEFTPSYELHLIEYRAVLKPRYYDDFYDHQRDEIDDWVRDGIDTYDWVKYTHVSDVDRHVEQHPECFKSFGEEPIPEDSSRDEMLEGYREYCQANCVL